MARLLRIESCWECSNYLGQDEDYDQSYCDRMDGSVVESNGIGIPDWCPLPEVEEATNDDATE